MKVKQLAELTGVSVRTVRYYHQIGLLAVPEVIHGRREYDASHVARLSRVRWLAETGLSLSQIGALLADERTSQTDERESVMTDLRGALAGLRERADQLSGQVRRLEALLAWLAEGNSLSAMPAMVSAFYDALEAGAPDEVTWRAIRRERDFLEVAFVRGDVPPEAELLFAPLDDDSLRETLTTFRRNITLELTDEAVADFAAAQGARIKERFGDRIHEVARSIDVTTLTRLLELFAATGDARDRAKGKAVEQELVRIIEKERAR